MPGTELAQTATPDEIVEYYTALLIAQYYNKPKAIGTVDAFVRELVADNIYTQVRDGFDLDTAVGNQLDFIGKLRGTSRYYFTLDLLKTYWGLPTYDTAESDVPVWSAVVTYPTGAMVRKTATTELYVSLVDGNLNNPLPAMVSDAYWGYVGNDPTSIATYLGLSTYDLPQPPAWYTMLYDDFIASTLLDGDFRRVIKYLARIHSCDYSLEALDAIFFEFFAGNVNIVDNEDMTIEFQHLTSDTDNLFEIVNQMNLLPHPAGVSYTVSEVPSF
jgi:hypothetical protein